MRRRIALGVGAVALAVAGFLLATRNDGTDPEPGPQAVEGARTAPTTTGGTTGPTPTHGDAATTGAAPVPTVPTVPTVVQDRRRPLHIGAWEYFLRDADPQVASRKMGDARRAGLDSVILQLFWAPGQRRPAAHEVRELRNAAVAARRAEIEPLVIVTHTGSRTTPRTALLREQFATYTAQLARLVPQFRQFIIGNEPNLNRFWLPQFGPNGENVAARDYLALLAQTYDALKDVSDDIRVVGGALAPRGGDDPSSARHTHSPTQFIRDLGRYYRESGREKPVMDAFAHHPYLESSRLSPSLAHPRVTTISLADYGKLVNLLGEAFDGTAQPGFDLPVLYTEFGVQTRIPATKRGAYTNHTSPVAADAVSEGTQQTYYREAVELACDQPTVEGLYIFHVWDEPDLFGWQSGLYYADHTPKSSRGAFLDLPSCR
jgi:hypothetical protein